MASKDQLANKSKVNPYLYSVNLDYYKSLSGRAGEKLAAKVYGRIEHALLDIIGESRGGKQVSISNSDRPKYQAALSMLLANALFAHRYDKKLYLAYSRNKNSYNNFVKRFGCNFSYVYIVRVVDALLELKLIKHAIGVYNVNSNFKKQSRYRASRRLVTLFDKFELTYSSIEYKRPLVVVKDSYKQIVETPNGRLTSQMTQNLLAINTLINSAKITLDATPAMIERLRQLYKEKVMQATGHDDDSVGIYDPTKTSLYRVFNSSSLTEGSQEDDETIRGGRFYGHYVQLLPKEYRA